MNEVMNVKHTIKNLLESGVTSYQIEKETSVSRAKIGRLRNGKNKIDNLTLETIEKLYNYQKGLEVMEKSIEIKDQNNIVLIDSLGQFFTDIENDNNGRYNVEYALLNEVEHDNGNTYYEVQINRTEEVPFSDKVTQDNVELLEDKWLAIDQQGENYVESVFFGNEEDAKEYIKLVLKGHKTFEEAAKAIGVIK
ncbi:hypothetical protein [Staphylococcus coagulans]|uniref:hypothetical protein n=1 Tax=Staphylococcus coagulans TaxID=74706 RepID=UPI0030EF36C0